MTTRARLVETVEQYRVRQERAAEGGATFRSDRGDDARKLLALVSAVERWADMGDGFWQGFDAYAPPDAPERAVRAALLSITTDPEARDG